MSLFIRNLFFTLLQPGIVAGLIPWIILEEDCLAPFQETLGSVEVIGVALFTIGLFVMIHCIAGLAIHGKGTLSPVDPSKKLVVKGLYRYSRNPMYVGVMMILIGEAIFFQSYRLLIYSGVVYLGFNIFIVLIEEPRLKKDFGEEYTSYRDKVRRWL